MNNDSIPLVETGGLRAFDPKISAATPESMRLARSWI